MNTSVIMDKTENIPIIDIGMTETRIGMSFESFPFKLIPTPFDLFFNPHILVNEFESIYNLSLERFRTKFQEFIYHISFNELNESFENNEIIILLNMLLPMDFIESVQYVILNNIGASKCIIMPSQKSSIYLSPSNSGIILDFGFTNISFIPFYSGFVLEKGIRVFKTSGLNLFRKMHESLSKLNQKFDSLSFENQFLLIKKIAKEVLYMPLVRESEIIHKEYSDEKNAMTTKTVKVVFMNNTWFYNYIENFRNSNYFFEDAYSVVDEFISFLFELPVNLLVNLISNIIPTGGLIMMTNFFQRFQEELVQKIDLMKNTNETLIGVISSKLSFPYMLNTQNIIGWVGG